ILSLQLGGSAARRSQDVHVTIKPDEAMMREVGQRARLPIGVDIVAVGEQPELHTANTPGDQCLLRWPHKANGDIRVTAQEVLVAVGQRKFELDLGMLARELRE